MTGLRFCMVTTFYPPYNFGGDGMGIQRLSQALVRRGHQVTVVQDIDPFNYLSSGRVPNASEIVDDGVNVIRLRSGFGRLSMLLTHQTGRPVVHGKKIRSILSQGFDVINFHNISLVGGPGLLRAGHAVKLYMAHEHWLVCPSHVLWRHNREACVGPECLRCVLHFHRPPQLWRYTGYLDRQLKHVDCFIAMSEFSRQKHREMGFGRDMEVVNYFLPEKPMSTPQRQAPERRPYFLFVGRLERIKGLDDVIPVFRHYTGADLVIIGDGDHGPELRKLAEGIPHVRFLGRLAPEQLDDYYRNALALIVPSAGFETFGIILIEAFRQGTPVIARRIGPFPEIVDRCKGGELFSTPGELVEAMERFRVNPALRQTMARNAYEGFHAYWSESAVLPAYMDVIRRAAQRSGNQGILERLEVKEQA